MRTPPPHLRSTTLRAMRERGRGEEDPGSPRTTAHCCRRASLSDGELSEDLLVLQLAGDLKRLVDQRHVGRAHMEPPLLEVLAFLRRGQARPDGLIDGLLEGQAALPHELADQRLGVW